MIRWPYRFRKPEGVKKGIPKLRALWYIFDCLMENLFIRIYPLVKCELNNTDRKEKVVVSMTSFPARIDKAYYAIKSLMIQSYKPDRIIMWLAKEQFPNQNLPEKIRLLENKGVEIKWCDDLRSHKKYHYALQQQNDNEVVITYDDDIIYEYDSIEKLIKGHKQYPNSIICNRAHEITLDSNGNIQPYSEWKIHSSLGTQEPSYLLMPSTGNGCLYPFHIMPDVTFDWQLAKKNALTADDIWMKYCSWINHVTIFKTRETIATLCNVIGSQKERLTQINDINGENQQVIDRLQVLFGEKIIEKSD